MSIKLAVDRQRQTNGWAARRTCIRMRRRHYIGSECGCWRPGRRRQAKAEEAAPSLPPRVARKEAKSWQTEVSVHKPSRTIRRVRLTSSRTEEIQTSVKRSHEPAWPPPRPTAARDMIPTPRRITPAPRFVEMGEWQQPWGGFGAAWTERDQEARDQNGGQKKDSSYNRRNDIGW
ncbi:hypothetical protein BKA81DRAFT_426874 [Phyllosticta paracitricarpa]